MRRKGNGIVAREPAGCELQAALYGPRPVMTRQGLDLALPSMGGLVNNAAKWRFMYRGHRGVPLTVRMVLGRGSGHGPIHARTLQNARPAQGQSA